MKAPINASVNSGGDNRDDIFWYRPGSSSDSLWSGTTARTFTATNYTTPPPTGAKVYNEGRLLGLTPVRISTLSPGTCA